MIETIEKKKDSILLLLQFHNRMYTNPNGVSLYLGSCGSVILTSNYPKFDPGEDYPNLAFWKEYPNVDTFREKLSINTKKQLDEIDSRFLIRQFKKGKIDVSCYVETNGKGLTLLFRKEKHNLFAHNLNHGKIYEINKELTNALDFITYTNNAAQILNLR